MIGIGGAMLPGHTAAQNDSQTETTVTVRYIVNDVPASVEFYTTYMGFTVALNPGPGFASVARGPLRLALSGVGGQGGGARAMPDGRKPEPGGWNRIQIPVSDLAAEVARLRTAGLRFRNDIVKGNGGLQILLDDPSGNPIELFQAYWALAFVLHDMFGMPFDEVASIVGLSPTAAASLNPRSWAEPAASFSHRRGGCLGHSGSRSETGKIVEVDVIAAPARLRELEIAALDHWARACLKG